MFTLIWVLVYLVPAVLGTRPPSIWLEPPYEVYFKAGQKVELPCNASGEPQPEYRWERNEVEYNPGGGNDNRGVQLPGVGTLVFNSPQQSDEGIYQCFALNSFGTSVSKKVILRQATLEEFVSAAPITYTPRVGERLTLPCVVPDSVPLATVFWANKLDSGETKALQYNNRVTVDREFRLRFINVQMEDRAGGLPYVCLATNNITGTSSMGPLYYIKPIVVTTAYVPADYFWSDQDDRDGLRGENFSIKCIFSGNPAPDVWWLRVDGAPLPSRFKTSGLELEITDLQFEDAGTYQCYGKNAFGGPNIYRIFTLRVNSKPYFLEDPHDVETGVGANVEFTCAAGGVPEPDIDWFINGVALRDVTDPRITSTRFQRPVENKIYLESVQQTDSMVVQCNASNIHGYVFADVYLNVSGETTDPTNTEGKTSSVRETTTKLTTRRTFPDYDEYDSNVGHSVIIKSGGLLAVMIVTLFLLSELV